MGPKVNISKLAWLWAEHTAPSDITMENMHTAYRTSHPPCPAGFCRKNCKMNPNCYNGLGEKAWMEKNFDEELRDALCESAAGFKRDEGNFVGLKNLGATCYANTFLQVWFHNPEFRRGILDCYGDPSADFIMDPESAENLFIPTSLVGHLQLLFALMSFSNRPYIDPSPFVECLQLDTSVQQDAQEFSKLLLTLLQDHLSSRGLNLIQHQFAGHYAYITRCSGCGQQSRREEEFHEIVLNIKGHRLFSDCLQEFLQEEKLEGENQYSCEFCKKKQDAVRTTRLLDLPPTLSFQLLRFVFDRQTQRKKKLTSCLQFPETLNMNEYMKSTGGDSEDMIYDLVSVLIHRGPAATSGHYVAVIQDCNTRSTYRFNDEEVEKLSAEGFRLEVEDDADGIKTGQKKNHLTSRNAYLLVYRRRNSVIGNGCPPLTFECLPEHLRQIVDSDNKKHEESVRDQLETKKFYIDKQRERQEMVKEFYARLQNAHGLERDDSFEWVHTNWLRKWLSEDAMGTVPPIDNQQLLCVHEKLHPDNIALAKLIPTTAADLIYEKFGGCMRLPCDTSVCRQCAEEKCGAIHAKVMIAEDNKTIALLVKSKDLGQSSSTNYWIGKKSLKRWRGLAEAALQLSSASPKRDDGDPENGMDDKNTNVNSSTSRENHTSAISSSDNGKMDEDEDPCNLNSGSSHAMDTTPAQDPGEAHSDEEGEEDMLFNEDLLCTAHDDLTVDLSTRKLVSEDVWLLLRKYFPNSREFTEDAPVCRLCQLEDEKEKGSRERDKALAAEQKHLLMDLYMDKRRPTMVSLTEGCRLNVISSQFLEDWRRFLKDANRYPVVSHINNKSLLCCHEGFMYDVNISEQLNTKYAYIYPQEWETLTTFVQYDVEIFVLKKGSDLSDQQFEVFPEFCQRCCDDRQKMEYSSQFAYENKVIYVRKVTDETRRLFLRTCASKAVASSTAPATTSDDGDTEEQNDAANENGKRKQQNDGGPGEKISRLEMPSSSQAPIRRSARKGKTPHEMQIEVSSTQTLRDLKLQLVKSFAVMKMDQHLYLDGVELVDESSTLEELRVLPESILYLQADEPSNETTFLDPAPTRSIEEGFKGTSLLGR